jgi:hypothetical protein
VSVVVYVPGDESIQHIYPRTSTGNKRIPIRQHFEPPILTSKPQPVVGFRMGFSVFPSLYLNLFPPHCRVFSKSFHNRYLDGKAV